MAKLKAIQTSLGEKHGALSSCHQFPNQTTLRNLSMLSAALIAKSFNLSALL